MKRLLRWLAALALLAAAGASVAQPQQRLLAAQSEIAFTSRQMGVPVDGRFRKFDAEIAFDPLRPQAARIALRIDLASVALASADAEAELAKPGWFDSRRRPVAEFTSSAVRPAGANRFDVAGRLTIKGVTREIVVPVTLAAAGASAAVASGGFTLQRLAFGIGDGDWSDTSLVADDVRVRFRLVVEGLGVP